MADFYAVISIFGGLLFIVNFFVFVLFFSGKVFIFVFCKTNKLVFFDKERGLNPVLIGALLADVVLFW